MKAGSFNYQEYLDKLNEEASENTEKGFTSSDKNGIPMPEDTKRNFDWLNKEYQKGKVEVKVEIKGSGSSFEPGYDLQTDLKSVKDFKPGMYGDVKTEDTEKENENPPKDKDVEVSDEKVEEPAKESKKENNKQSIKLDITPKKKKND